MVYTDVEKAENGPYVSLIASGIQTIGVAMRLVADVLTITILETKQSHSRQDLGILRWQWQLFNGDRDEVLDLEATSFFELS